MFVVNWSSRAREKLLDLVQGAAAEDRQAIRRAAKTIISKLTQAADKVGESRVRNFRLIVEPPLAAYYWLGQDDYLDTAIVTHVWLVKGRHQGNG